MKRTIKKLVSVLMVCTLLLTGSVCMTSAAPLKKLDLVFVVDSTGSMGDDINQVKRDMQDYVLRLEEAAADFKVAIIDYRDFQERTGYSQDYPYKMQIDFTDDIDAIQEGINKLYAYGGGDWEETIYSALIDGLDLLSWRQDAGKAVILMGDAPALDPEPITGYVLEDAISKLKDGKIAKHDVDYTVESVSEMGILGFASVQPDAEKNRSPITLFAIATNNNELTVENFSALAEGTGGASYLTDSATDISQVVEEILDVIPNVVVEPTLWERIKTFFANLFNKLWYIITFQWLF